MAEGLADFDLEVQIAGMLHDVVEDTGTTIDDLRAQCVPERSLDAIALVSKNLHPDLTYAEAIAQICLSRDATLVKISDNAHNTLPDRVAALGRPADPKYAEAGVQLHAVVPREDVELILRRANPSLLSELG